MEFETVCYVNASSERFGSKGVLSLLRVSDTIYISEYKDSRRSISVDLDLVTTDKYLKTISFSDTNDSKPSELNIFNVDDEAELQLFLTAKTECETVCDLNLRLNSLLRDVYYSGFYNTVETDHKLLIGDEIEKLKMENPNIFFTALVTSGLAQQLNGEYRASTSTTLNKKECNGVPLCDIVCAFCGTTGSVDKDREFVVHPYVPQTFSGQQIHMCSICIENWKEYRDAAEHEQQLVLEDEINEEICAVCSDTPETLVLCSGCPRSFCDHCLGKILSDSELREITAVDADWICMCCLCGVPQSPPLSRDAWKKVSNSSGTSSDSAAAAAKLKAREIANLSRASALMPTQPADPPRKKARVEDAVGGGGDNKEEPAPQADGRRRKAAKEDSAGYNDDDDNQGARPSNAADGRRPPRKSESGKPPSSQSAAPVPALPPVNQELDEAYYFSQYVCGYDAAAQTMRSGTKASVAEALSTTEDVCFLCKDGGELIECDWRAPSSSSKRQTGGGNRGFCRCLKVYHEYCLDYAVQEGVDWICPRHFCDMCGTRDLKYMCKYCPLAICAECPEEMVKTYGHANFSVLEDPLTGEFAGEGVGSVVPIACHSCCDMLGRSLARPGLLDGLTETIALDIQRFPGVPGKDAKRRSGIFKRRLARRSAGSAEDSSRSSKPTETTAEEAHGSGRPQRRQHPRDRL